MRKVRVSVRFLPGDRAAVLNHRMKPHQWEPCTVKGVTARFYDDLGARIEYEVHLDRLVAGARSLYVGDDKIADLPGRRA